MHSRAHGATQPACPPNPASQGHEPRLLQELAEEVSAITLHISLYSPELYAEIVRRHLMASRSQQTHALTAHQLVRAAPTCDAEWMSAMSCVVQGLLHHCRPWCAMLKHPVQHCRGWLIMLTSARSPRSSLWPPSIPMCNMLST